MKTDAVMCMALTRQSPSWTPLLRTRSSTVPVIFTNPRRFGTSNHKCSVRLFTGAVCHQRSVLGNCGNTAACGRISTPPGFPPARPSRTHRGAARGLGGEDASRGWPFGSGAAFLPCLPFFPPPPALRDHWPLPIGHWPLPPAGAANGGNGGNGGNQVQSWLVVARSG